MAWKSANFCTVGGIKVIIRVHSPEGTFTTTESYGVTIRSAILGFLADANPEQFSLVKIPKPDKQSPSTVTLFYKERSK